MFEPDVKLCNKLLEQLAALEHMQWSSEAEKVWMACALDGEGSLVLTIRDKNGYGGHGTYAERAAKYKKIRFRRIRAIINLSNTNIQFCQKAFEITKVGYIAMKNQRGLKCYEWRLENRPAILKLLLQVYPYLVIKRKQAELLISFLMFSSARPVPKRTYNPEELAYVRNLEQSIKLLNKRQVAENHV